jgi:hypothetical protein
MFQEILMLIAAIAGATRSGMNKGFWSRKVRNYDRRGASLMKAIERVPTATRERNLMLFCQGGLLRATLLPRRVRGGPKSRHNHGNPGNVG